MKDSLAVAAIVLGMVAYVAALGAWLAVLPTIGLMWSMGWIK